MSLDAARLERVRELPGGVVQARCPACAAGGHDRTGEHLRVYPDGRFGCCVHPKDKEHRKQIFALVGNRQPGTFTVRLKVAAATPTAKSVKAALTTPANQHLEDSRTPRTDVSELRARARVDCIPATIKDVDFHMDLKDSEQCVRGVRTGEKLPHLTSDGTLVIPFDSPERFHWWKGGQSVAETRKEVKEGKHGADI